MTVSDLDAIFAAILADPAEDLHRLAYADRLDERGEPGDAERAEFIRVQVEFALAPDCQFVPMRQKWPCRDSARPYAISCRPCLLHHRAQELWRHDETAGWFDWFGLGGFVLGNAPSPDEMTGVVRRGFVESLTLSAADWLANGDAIRTRHPVTRVVFTEFDPGEVTVYGDRWPEAVELRLTRFPDMDPMRLSRPEYMTRTGSHATWQLMASELFTLRWPGVTFDLPRSGGTGGTVFVGGQPVAGIADWRLRTGEAIAPPATAAIPTDGWAIEFERRHLEREIDGFTMYEMGLRSGRLSITLGHPAPMRAGDVVGPVVATDRHGNQWVCRVLVERHEARLYSLDREEFAYEGVSYSEIAGVPATPGSATGSTGN